MASTPKIHYQQPPRLVHEYLKEAANNLPGKAALVFNGDRFTYGELDSITDALSVALSISGLARHDKVAIFLDNSPEFVISIYGVLKASATFIPLNGSLKGRKLKYVLEDSGASILISHVNKQSVIIEALQGNHLPGKIIWVGESSSIPVELIDISTSWESALNPPLDKTSYGGPPKKERENCLDQDLAALIYTSGSTGLAKGIMSTHHSMISAAQSIIQYLCNSENDILICTLPLSFDYGLYQVIMTIMFGGTIVLERAFHFAPDILGRVRTEKVTGFPIVPSMVAMILELDDLSKYDLSSIRYISSTGQTFPVEHIRRFREHFPHIQVYSMFGLTECKRVSYLPPEEIDRRPQSVGIAMPNCEINIVDDMGAEVAPGETGEMIVRGSNVMSGYWNSPDLTDRVFRMDYGTGCRVLCTGDYFKQDEDGFLYFVGRRDDMIKTGGERVIPKEIEQILNELEGVLESAVIGIPDNILGQVMKAFVVKTSESGLTEQAILRYCRNNMELFMIPKAIRILNTLPRNLNGKIDKLALKEK